MATLTELKIQLSSIHTTLEAKNLRDEYDDEYDNLIMSSMLLKKQIEELEELEVITVEDKKLFHKYAANSSEFKKDTNFHRVVQKLPIYQGLLFRGCDSSEIVGESWCPSPISSFSKNKKVAQHFASGNLLIYEGEGYDNVFNNWGEDEVLVLSSTGTVEFLFEDKNIKYWRLLI